MIKIACVGDSLTYGYLVEDREVNCYPAVLNERLGDTYVVGNFGVNGHTLLKTGDAPYWNHENFKFSAMIEPDIVLIMLGSNDAKPHNFTTLEDFLQTYEEMIAYYRQLDSKPRIYMMTPPTVFPSELPKMSTISPEAVNEIAEGIRGLGKKLRLSVIDMNKKTADHPECFVSDGVHTNKKGAELIATVIFRELSKK
ncbi:MAG: GDSL-type esterase/lipase family protein [Defluviitaleaceae bacterium]|nr:GDSL-type esterase/lipase family protein [Defluviitaleaceae bacterium]